MGTIPTKLNDKTELITCLCGATRLIYKSDPKRFCSRTCQDKYQKRGGRKGRKYPRPLEAKLSAKQREHLENIQRIAAQKNRGKALSEETKQKLREASKRNWQDPEYRAKALGNRPEMTEELREFHRKRMADLWTEGFYDDKATYVQAGHGYHHGVWMRCLNSEGVFARELDRAGIAWEYEPRRFRLSWCSYTPDFYLPEFDLWIEVKGFLTEKAARKIDTFREETGKTLVLVMQKELPTRIYGGECDF